MTSRRSMLQGMAALWLGGWRGLGRTAVAQASSATPPTTASGTGLHCEYDDAPPAGGSTNDCSCVTYTYAADGRLLSEIRTGGQVRTYSYGDVP
jgi:YD repeat-containing protein